MEYIYAAMLLHKAGQEISEDTVTKVLTAAAVHVDHNRVKALIAALQGVDIEKAIATAAIAAAPAAAAPAAHAEEKKAKEKPKEEKSDTEAAAGLGALFG